MMTSKEIREFLETVGQFIKKPLYKMHEFRYKTNTDFLIQKDDRYYNPTIERFKLTPVEKRCEHCQIIVYNQHVIKNLVTGTQKCSICCKKYKP